MRKLWLVAVWCAAFGCSKKKDHAGSATCEQATDKDIEYSVGSPDHDVRVKHRDNAIRVCKEVGYPQAYLDCMAATKKFMDTMSCSEKIPDDIKLKGQELENKLRHEQDPSLPTAPTAVDETDAAPAGNAAP